MNKKYHNPRIKRVQPQWIAETQKKNRLGILKQKPFFKGGDKIFDSDKTGDK